MVVEQGTRVSFASASTGAKGIDRISVMVVDRVDRQTNVVVYGINSDDVLNEQVRDSIVLRLMRNRGFAPNARIVSMRSLPDYKDRTR